MAIQGPVKLSENSTLDKAYVKISNPTCFKDAPTEKAPDGELKLAYEIHVYSEKEGKLLDSKSGNQVTYNGGHVWEEAYADLLSKKEFKSFENV